MPALEGPCAQDLILAPRNALGAQTADQLIGNTAGMKRLIADRGHDANRIRATLRLQHTILVVPGCRNRKRAIRHDETRYEERWRVEAMFCRPRDFRRVATRYDKRGGNCRSAVMRAAAGAFWLRLSRDLGLIPPMSGPCPSISCHVHPTGFVSLAPRDCGRRHQVSGAR